MKKAFSLVEILLSLLVLSGSIVSLMAGIQIAQELNKKSKFEEAAAFYAEREMEMLKCDLLSGKIPPRSGKNRGRFRLPGGWKNEIFRSAPGETGVMRLVSKVSFGKDSFTLESFLYVPQGSAN